MSLSEINNLREALRPFAKVYEAELRGVGEYRHSLSDDEYISVYYHGITALEFRKAYEALKGHHNE